MHKTTLLSTTALVTASMAAAGMTVSARAADIMTMEPAPAPVFTEESLPAVSAPNAKIDAAFGVLDDDFLALGTGAFTVPLGHSFGFQLDGMAAYTDDDDDAAFGAGGHLFWRDPATGLLGLYGAYTWVGRTDTDNVGQIAAEGELYLGNFTVGAVAGVGFGDDDLDDANFFGRVDLSAYLTEDFRLYGGYRYQVDQHMGTIGAEFMPGWGGASLFAEGTVAEDDEYMVFAGLRYYFGPQKSLIRRHREDDPAIFLPPNLLVKGSDDSCSMEDMMDEDNESCFDPEFDPPFDPEDAGT